MPAAAVEVRGACVRASRRADACRPPSPRCQAGERRATHRHARPVLRERLRAGRPASGLDQSTGFGATSRLLARGLTNVSGLRGERTQRPRARRGSISIAPQASLSHGRSRSAFGTPRCLRKGVPYLADPGLSVHVVSRSRRRTGVDPQGSGLGSREEADADHRRRQTTLRVDSRRARSRRRGGPPGRNTCRRCGARSASHQARASVPHEPHLGYPSIPPAQVRGRTTTTSARVGSRATPRASPMLALVM